MNFKRPSMGGHFLAALIHSCGSNLRRLKWVLQSSPGNTLDKSCLWIKHCYGPLSLLNSHKIVTILAINPDYDSLNDRLQIRQSTEFHYTPYKRLLVGLYIHGEKLPLLPASVVNFIAIHNRKNNTNLWIRRNKSKVPTYNSKAISVVIQLDTFARLPQKMKQGRQCWCLLVFMIKYNENERNKMI